MKTNIDLRFALYVLWVTAGVAIPVVWWYFPDVPWILLLILMPSPAKLIGKENRALLEPDHPVSNRALVWGFLGFLAIFWIGALLLAHYISPQHHPAYLIWGALGVIWFAFLYPGYRWWTQQKGRAAP